MTDDTLKIELTEIVKGISIIEMQGALDISSISKANSLIKPLIAEGTIRLVFDCSQLDYVNSPALGTLISYYKSTKKLGGDCIFFGIKDKVYEVMSTVGLTKTFSIVSTKEEALRSFGI